MAGMVTGICMEVIVSCCLDLDGDRRWNENNC